MRIIDAVESMVKNLDLFGHTIEGNVEVWTYDGRMVSLLANAPVIQLPNGEEYSPSEEARRVLIHRSLTEEEKEQLNEAYDHMFSEEKE